MADEPILADRFRVNIAGVVLSVLVGAGIAWPSSAQVKLTGPSNYNPKQLPGPGATKLTANRPVLITADELRYNREKHQVIAVGHVEISQGDRVVLADRVIYDQNTKIVTALGNVSMTEPTGETVFADKVVLKDNLKDGLIENFRLLFPDNTKIAANSVRRTGGVRSVMSKVVFSPCSVCRNKPSSPPLWQLKARKVIHHQDTHEIDYYDAWLEVFGVPVLYTPYLSHPDPTVRRRSGFLAPSFGSDSQLGIFTKTPYFWAISEDKDLTITPMITTKQRGDLFLEYRQRFKNGQMILSGSFTRAHRLDAEGNRISGDVNRGHFFGKARWDINPHWRAGINGYWASDATYLRRYAISNVETLPTTAWVEGFHGRDYTAARVYHFQGMRVTDHYRKTPIIFPFVEHYGYSRPRGQWGRLNYSLKTIGVNRLDGVDSRRMTGTLGWRLPYTLPSGIVITATANLHGQVYWITGLARPGADKFSGVIGRLYPQAKIDVRYPFVREFGNVRQVIEPRVALIASPAGLNTSKIPNEDSIDFEFDDANLFAANRYPGQDRIDDGVRLVYGVNTSFFGNRGGATELFLGQSYRLTGGRSFGAGSGLQNKLSDVVGRIRLAPASYLNLVYRFRFDARKFRARRNEVTLHAGVPALNLSVNYLYFAATQNTPEFPSREEVAFALKSRIARRWSVFGGARWDLAKSGGILNWQMGGQFKNECCTVRATYLRTFTRDRDVRPTNRFLIRIVLKHLGEINTGG